MIEIFEDGDNGPPSRYCSQHCRSLHKGTGGTAVSTADLYAKVLYPAVSIIHKCMDGTADLT